MTNIPVKFFKVTALPDTCEPSSFYYIEYPNFILGYLTDMNGVPKLVTDTSNIAIPKIQVIKSKDSNIPEQSFYNQGAYIQTLTYMRNLYAQNSLGQIAIGPNDSQTYPINHFYDQLHSVFLTLFHNPNEDSVWMNLNPRIFLFRKRRTSRVRTDGRPYYKYNSYAHPPTVNRTVTDPKFYNGNPTSNQFNTLYAVSQPESLLFGNTEWNYSPQEGYKGHPIKIDLKNWIKPSPGSRTNHPPNFKGDGRFEFPLSLDMAFPDYAYLGPFGGSKKDTSIKFKFAIGVDNPFYGSGLPIGKHPILFGDMSDTVHVKLIIKSFMVIGYRLIIT